MKTPLLSIFALLAMLSVSNGDWSMDGAAATAGAGTGRVDKNLAPELTRAGVAAEKNKPYRLGNLRCWAAVKESLMASGAVRSKPKSTYAKDAGKELTENYGFVKVGCWDPSDAAIGTVLVYSGGPDNNGHVELRTPHGFASDYFSPWHCRFKFEGAYILKRKPI